MKLRQAVSTAVFVFALFYLLLLRPYGFQLEDEGTLLFWFDRVLAGQRPYVDFHTGYTPGFFAFGSAVFGLFGPSATSLRAVLAVMNAVSAAGLTEIARRVAGWRLAWIPPLVWLLFVPVYAGEFAAFNVPYPTWPVTLAWVALALAMLAWIENRRISTLVIAGAAAAFAMWMRPNSGAFALAAATWIVVATTSRPRALDRLAAPLAAASMALGVWYTFEFRLAGMDAFVHLVPAAAVYILCTESLAARLDNDAAPGATISLAMLAAAFLAPTLAWTLPLLSTLGRERFLYEVFLVGADYQSLYYKPHPSPEPYAVLVVVGILALAVCGRLVAARRVRPVPLLAGIAVIGGVLKIALLRQQIAPEGLLHSISLQLENASFWLAAVTSFGAVLWLARVPAQELARSRRSRALVVLVPLSIAMYMQMFPRSDFMHEVTAVPLTAVVACALLARVASWWTRGQWPQRWNGRRIVRRSVCVAAAGVLVLAAAEKLCGPVEALTSSAPASPISDRLDVHVEAAAGDELTAIGQTVDFLRRYSAETDPLWSFPATSGLLFAAGRTNAAPHDYWYPGRPDHFEEERVLGLLRARRPSLVVTLNKGWDFFAASPAWFAELREWVVGQYRLVARFGRYDVLARRDLPEFAGLASIAESRPRPAPLAAANAEHEAIEANLERRRQAAWRWMDALVPADAAAAALPADRRDGLLLLRALRDGGDMRAAGWIVLGCESTDLRIRSEAGDALIALNVALDALKSRFANDFHAQALRPFVEPWTGRAKQLAPGSCVRATEDSDPQGDFADALVDLAGEPTPSPGAASAPPATVSHEP